MTTVPDDSTTTELRERIAAAVAGRYEVQQAIGHGASAVVYAARDVQHFGRDVAIKVIRPEVAGSLGAGRFSRELQITARLTHAHILPLLDWGEADGLLYYVMPHVAGESLRTKLQRENQLALDEAVRITRDVASALQYAHEHGVAHRDVKPENILIAGGVASLADFGLARDLSLVDSVTASGIAVGTAAYMSPEQASGGHGDARSDQYALACVLYEMLAGDPPFHATTVQALLARHRSDPAPSLTSVRRSIPPGIEAALQRALAKVPADRFASVAQFALAIEGALTSATLAAVRRPEGRGSAAPLRFALGGLALLLLVTLSLWGVRSLLDRVGGPDLDPNRLAVAPFDTFDAQDSLWRGGMVDLLSRSFDGAGPLRAVAPSVVLRTASGRSDAASARQLAERTAAGLAIFGQLVRVGADSARLSATLYDVAARVDRLADSLAVRLLRALARTRSIAATPRSSLGTSSLQALRTFLQGEQAYRFNDMERARDLYERALALDTSFTLAYHGMSAALRAIGQEGNSEQLRYAAAAGARNHGLGLRDSLLVAADSLLSSLPRGTVFFTEGDQNRLRRRVHTLERAVATYPDDPAIVMELGEAILHSGYRLGRTAEDALRSFERAIALDSAFTPAYFHATEVALALRGPAAARRLAQQFMRIRGGDARFAVLADMLSPNPDDSIRALARASRVRGDTLLLTAYLALRSTETPDVALRIYRLLAERDSGRVAYDAGTVRYWTFVRNLWLGRYAEAARVMDESIANLVPLHVWLLARNGALRRDSMNAIATRWSRSGNFERIRAALSWYGAQGDTVALRGIRHPAGPDTGAISNERIYARYAVLSYMALARRDTTAALNHLAALPDSLCAWTCWPEVALRARLLTARGDTRAAAAFLDRHPPPGTSINAIAPLWLLERKRVAQAMGDTATLRYADSSLSRLWRGADSLVKR
jgi:eukaryotic-like serine/threonine-protein kinase